MTGMRSTVDLWTFAQTVAATKRSAAAFSRWIAVNREGLSPSRRRRALVDVQDYGNELDEALDRRVVWAKFRAECLFRRRIPRLVWAELLKGRYTITGRRNGEGKPTRITVDDIAGLAHQVLRPVPGAPDQQTFEVRPWRLVQAQSVDLERNRLVGHEVYYSEIAIRLSDPQRAGAPLGALRKGGRWQRDPAVRAIKAQWPLENPRETTPMKKIRADVIQWLTDEAGHPVDIKPDTLRRALDDHAANIARTQRTQR
jgi:hypothetical protein